MNIISPKKKKVLDAPAEKITLRQRVVPWLLILISGGALLYVLLSNWQLPEQESENLRYRAEVKKIALQMAERLEPIKMYVQSLAEDPDYLVQIEKNKSILLSVVDPKLDDLLSLRLIHADASAINDDAEPILSFACFDLVSETAKSTKPVRAEAHLFGKTLQHIDFVHGVRNQDGKAVGGVVASLSIELFQKILPTLGKNQGYLELRQGSQSLAKVGTVADRSLSPFTSPIAGSRWSIAYWPENRTTQDQIDYAVLRLFAVVATAGIILIIAVLLALRDWRRTKRYADAFVPEAVQRDSELVDDGLGSGILYQDDEGLIVVDEDEDGGETDDESKLEHTEPNQHESILEGMNISPDIFKAYDIRGIIEKDLTEVAVFAIGRALGSEAQDLGQKLVVIGHDGRLSSPGLSKQLSEGLRHSGVDVIDIGLVPTPVLYYATLTLGTGSGVMVTGSHNPINYNGLKIMLAGKALAGEYIQAIRKRIDDYDYHEGKGQCQEKSIIEDYISHITDDVMLIKPFKVVVDCANGAAATVVPELLRHLGCTVVEMYCEVDGNFPNHHPDPSRPENMKDLAAKVKAEQADIGLAFDGDGDRLGVVSTSGDIIWPDRLMMLFATDVLSRHPGAEIIFDVKCTSKLAEHITEKGGVATMWNTGHSLIKAKMRQTGALLAGEMSGHIFFKERWHGFDDASYAAARLLELLGPMTADCSVDSLLTNLPNSVNTPELIINMAEGANHVYMKKFIEKAHFKKAEITTIDGFRADFKDGWGLIRASNTTPSLVLRFEADSDIVLARIMADFRNVMIAADPAVNLSF